MFRLARDLSKTVTELEKTMSSYELVEWMAFCKNEYEAAEERKNLLAESREKEKNANKEQSVKLLRAKFSSQTSAYNKLRKKRKVL